MGRRSRKVKLRKQFQHRILRLLPSGYYIEGGISFSTPQFLHVLCKLFFLTSGRGSVPASLEDVPGFLIITESLLAESCYNRVMLCWAKLWVLNDETSVQPAICLLLGDTRSSRSCHREFVFGSVSYSKMGRGARMAFPTVVLVTLIEQELICLWGLWSCHFQN